MAEVTNAPDFMHSDTVDAGQEPASGPRLARRPRREREPVGPHGRMRDDARRDTRSAKGSLVEAKTNFKTLAQDALEGDQGAKDALAIALTGKTYDELSEEADQKEVFETLLADVADGTLAPKLRVVGQGDVNGSEADALLPQDVDAAFVPGKDGAPGTILIAQDLVGSGRLDQAVSEEMGEAIAQHASDLGLQVHEGDIGARMKVVASGDELDEASGLFEADPTDTAMVRLDGEVVEAKALFGIPGTDFIPDPLFPDLPGVDVPPVPVPDPTGGVIVVDPDGSDEGLPGPVDLEPIPELPEEPVPADPLAPEPTNGWLGSALVDSGAAQNEGQVQMIVDHLFKSDGALEGFPANGVLSAYEIKDALSKGFSGSLPVPVSDQMLGQLEALVRAYGTVNPDTGYFAVDKEQLALMVQEGRFGLGVSAFAGSRTDVVVVSADPIEQSPELGHWWNTAIEKIEDGGKAIAHAISKWTGHKVEDIEHYFSGEMTAAEAAAKGIGKMAQGFAKEVVAGTEAAVGAFDKIAGAVTGIKGLSAEGQAWVKQAQADAKSGGADMMVGMVMAFGSMDEAKAKDIINQATTTFGDVEHLMNGGGEAIINDLTPLLEGIVNEGAALQAGVSTADVFNGDDPLQKRLSADPKARFDYAIDLGQAVSTSHNFDVGQFRAFVTHPRRVENGKHMMQLRLRFLDVAGVAEGGADAGILGVHDLVIPFEFTGAFQNVSVQAPSWSATVGAMGEYAFSNKSPGEIKAAAEFIKTNGTAAYEKIKGLVNGLQAPAGALGAGQPILGALAPFDGIEGVAENLEQEAADALGIAERFLGPNAQERLTFEAGVGVGLNSNYKLGQIWNGSRSRIWTPFIYEAVGALAGGAIVGAAEAALYTSGAAADLSMNSLLKMAHAGATIGSGIGDAIADFADDSLRGYIDYQGVGFLWGAARYQRGDTSEGEGLKGILRGRFQGNYDFWGSDITLNPTPPPGNA